MEHALYGSTICNNTDKLFKLTVHQIFKYDEAFEKFCEPGTKTSFFLYQTGDYCLSSWYLLFLERDKTVRA